MTFITYMTYCFLTGKIDSFLFLPEIFINFCTINPIDNDFSEATLKIFKFLLFLYFKQRKIALTKSSTCKSLS